MWNGSPTILNILSIIRFEILESKCTHVVEIVDSASDNFFAISSDTYTSSALILPMPMALNRRYGLSYVPTLHFSSICSLILRDLTNLASTFSRESYSEPLGQELVLPEYTFPGYPHYDYHVFTHVAESGDNMAEQRLFAHLTRRIQNAFFLFVNESSLKVFRTSSSNQKLHLISEKNLSELGNSTDEKLLKIDDYSVTYNGAQLTTMTCPICGQAFELFEATGEWFNPYDAIVYDAYKSVNPTILFQGVPAVAKMKPDEDGDWDEWVAPLADESAAVAILQPMSVARLRAFHYPMAYLNDHITFITAPPRRLRATRNSFARFMSPLTKEIWLCVAATIVGLFISIEITVHLHEWTALYPPGTGSHAQGKGKSRKVTAAKLDSANSEEFQVPSNAHGASEANS